MDVGARIKELRKENNMEQKELAKLLHVSPKTISSWEVNRTQPRMEMIDEMCKVFGCKRSTFLQDNKSEEDFIEILIERYTSADELDRELVNRVLHLEAYVDAFQKLLKKREK